MKPAPKLNKLGDRTTMAAGGLHKTSANDQTWLAPQWPPILVASAALATLCIATWQVTGNWRLVAIIPVGALAGLSLYHASFGFTAAWRRFTREGRGAGLRAQCLLIGLVCLVSFPLIDHGADWGLRTGGFVFPVGVSTALGAFLFGIGMQLGGGCGSGTLFTAGGGSTRMMITLAAFIGGSVWATADLHWWNGLPSIGAHSLVREAGATRALLVTLAFLIGIAALTAAIERRRHGSLEPPRATGPVHAGPWSLGMGALMLAVVCILTLLILQRPWGITSAFALWGGKIAHGVGIDIAAWPFWANGMGAVERSVLHDANSVMNFGIMLGALTAAGLAHRFAPKITLTSRDIATAIIGGLMMGYGARLAFGCNIGGFLGGVISGSLHGWSWLVFGFMGSVLGTSIRSRIGMDPAPMRT
jgi:uncharacterized membrane protein YedE/YeeE